MIQKEDNGLLGLMSRLLSRSDASLPKPSDSCTEDPSDYIDTTQVDGNLLAIESLNFLGQGIRSANQRWFLAYGQIHDPRASSWSSDDPTGAVILFDKGNLVCRIDGLYRPETVAVSDAGVFVVYEWGPSSEFLGSKCSLQVFTATGERVYQFSAGAAIELPALSADGRLLAFHTLALEQA